MAFSLQHIVITFIWDVEYLQGNTSSRNIAIHGHSTIYCIGQDHVKMLTQHCNIIQTKTLYTCPEGLIWLTMNVFDMGEKRRFYQSRYLQEIILRYQNNGCVHGPLTRYVKLRVAYAPGMPGTFSPALRASDPDMHHGMCVKHVPWCRDR